MTADIELTHGTVLARSVTRGIWGLAMAMALSCGAATAYAESAAEQTWRNTTGAPAELSAAGEADGFAPGRWSFRGKPVNWENHAGFRVRIIEAESPDATEQVARADLSDPMGLGMASDATDDTAEAPADGASQTRSILFEGWRIDRRLVGRAELRVPGCENTFAYEVRGWLSPDGTTAAFTGTTPVIEDCKIVGQDPFGPGSTLVFHRER